MKTITKSLIFAVFALLATTSFSQVIFEENFTYLTMEDKDGSSFKPDEFDLFFDNLGWTGVEMAKGDATKDTEHPNYVNKPRVGYWSADAYLTSPTIDLSEGDVTVSVDLKAYARQKDATLMDYDKCLLLHAPDGENFSLVSTFEGMNVNWQIFKAVIKDGTALSKIRISRVHPTENAPNRFFVGSFIIEKGDLTSIDNEELNQQVVVSLNSANDVLTVESDLIVQTIKVYTLLGQNVLQVNEDIKELNVADLHKGVYLIDVICEGGIRTTQKVVKR